MDWAGLIVGVALGLTTAGPSVPHGRIAPDVRLEGRPEQGACSFVVRSAAERFESATGGALEVPAGDYRLDVECRHADGVLAPASLMVKVSAGKTSTPKIDVRSARIRVEARRNGIMLPAK